MRWVGLFCAVAALPLGAKADGPLMPFKHETVACKTAAAVAAVSGRHKFSAEQLESVGCIRVAPGVQYVLDPVRDSKAPLLIVYPDKLLLMYVTLQDYARGL